MRNMTNSDIYYVLSNKIYTLYLCDYYVSIMYIILKMSILTISSTFKLLTWAAINSSVSSNVLSSFFWFLISINSCIKSFRRTPLAFLKSIVCFTMPMKNFCTFTGNERSFKILNNFGKNTLTILANAKDADELSTAHPICLNSDCEFFSELHSRPNAHVPITSVVNLAVRSRISNFVSPDLMAFCYT